MKLNDETDADFDEEYLDDEDDYDSEFYRDEPSVRSRFISRREEEPDDLDSYADDYAAIPSEVERKPAAPKKQPKASKKKNKVTGIRQNASRSTRTSGMMEVCVIKPRSMEDCSEITDTLLENCTVILNMEGIDLALSQRIVDYTSGSTYALRGNLRKVSNYIFIVTPEGVDISGDYEEYMSDAFDVPAYGGRY